MMARRPLTDNEKAAVVAAIAGVLLLLSGVTGVTQWQRTFALLGEVLGTSLLLTFVRFVFVALGSAGGVFVLLGAYGFRQNKVRMGRALIWLGTGFTLVSVFLYVVLQVRHGDAPFAGAGLLGAVGIGMSIAARLKAKPLPLRR